MQFFSLVSVFKFTIAVLAIAMLFQGCDRLSVKDTLDGEEYLLIDQFDDEIAFPESFRGNVMLVGYVYTHCPDICPIITYNMRDVQRALPDEENFMLVSISFDPDRDSPEVLYHYAEAYRINQKNWRFLTGDRREVERLLGKLQIQTVKTPTRFLEENRPMYFIDHTDRVTLIDANGQVRRTYPGSEFHYEEIVEDIRVLLSEL
ncbi:MAG: SCO family protein [Balneolaceae bacterium]|nr:MAG: SCO family protein [Balneolaceae bacterium]